MINRDRPSVISLGMFGLNSPDSQRLLRFYEKAFSARVEIQERRAAEYFEKREAQVRGGAERSLLRLGESSIEVLQFDSPGAHYPHDLSPYDTRFQHFALVVSDMQQAMDELRQATGWSAISIGGSQTLPSTSGGVTAFKFRDPDGHPLELLQFADGKSPPHWKRSSSQATFRGIDHSAISVAEVDKSSRFYRSMGLTISSRTLNSGLEQARMDGIDEPIVDVIGLSPIAATPHVELLHYRTAVRPARPTLVYNDIAATRLIFIATPKTHAVENSVTKDPDGHFIEVLGESD